MREHLPPARSEAAPAFPTFDLHHAAALFVASFNHSQGNEELQNWLFDYLSRLHPKVCISEPFREALNKRAARLICRLFQVHYALDNAQPEVLHAGHVTLTPDLIDYSVEKELRRMQSHFDGLPKPRVGLLLTDPVLVAVIAAGFIERDYYWTVERPDGRPNRRRLRNTDPTPSHWTDPHFSYVVEHALKGHPTEVPEFDRLYAQIGHRYHHVLVTHNQQNIVSPETYDKLQAVIRHYNQTHPNRPLPLSSKGQVQVATLRT